MKACWIALAIYWAAAARSAKPSAERQGGLTRSQHLVTLAAAAALLIAPRWPYPLSLTVIPHGPAAAGGGVALCLCGLVVAVWARRTLGDNWSSAVTFKQGHELIVRGPYNYVRHPIYTGLLLMSLGTAVAIGRLHAWIGLLLCVVGFWVKLRQEEALMVRQFPDRYPAYRRRVKALIPFML